MIKLTNNITGDIEIYSYDEYKSNLLNNKTVILNDTDYDITVDYELNFKLIILYVDNIFNCGILHKSNYTLTKKYINHNELMGETLIIHTKDFYCNDIFNYVRKKKLNKFVNN